MILYEFGTWIREDGVKNNGDVIGQKDLNENTLRDISRKIAEGIKPQVIPSIALELIDDKKIINETKVKVGGIQRKEEKYFDFSSFKEAWLNAYVHTKWSEEIPPVVYIYDDRIEVVSNGGLPAALNEAELKILELIRMNPEYKTADFVKATNYSEVYVNKIIRNLKDKEYIARVGANKNGYWDILKWENK